VPAALRIDDEPGGVRVLTLSNPGRKNALDEGLLAQLDTALATTTGAGAFLIRGDGEGVFSAGWDLHALSTVPADRPLPDAVLGEVLDRLSAHPFPSVAMIDGPAYGAACELAMACDFRVAGAGAALSMPPARLGLVYSLKGLARFRERVGDATTRYLFLTGRRVAAPEALRRGLVDVLCEAPLAEARALCVELAGHAPLAIAGLKRGLSLLADVEKTPQAVEGYEALRRASFESADAREGRKAILEKRPPRFRGE